MSDEPAIKYSNCKDYFEVAAKALDEMVRQIKETKFDERGIMQKRHNCKALSTARIS